MVEAIVSILMPVKNASSFLDECIQSILDQSYQSWELIAVDDHSSDDSKSKIEAYEQADPRIKLLSNNGNGIIPALRLGLEMSTGLYISRMDADDKMSPNKIESLVNLLESENGISVSTGQVNYFSNTSIADGYKKYEDWLNGLMINETNFKEIYKECVIPSPCWMMRREDLLRIGAFNLDTYPEDYDLCFRMYEHQARVVTAKQILHHWRDYSDRTSRTHKHYADNRFLDLKIHYFLKLEYSNNDHLVLWGAGKKGKTIAKTLIDQNIEFSWLSNNDKKIALKIFDQHIQDCESFQFNKAHLIIIAVANKEAQNDIRQSLEKHGMEAAKDYFFFC